MNILTDRHKDNLHFIRRDFPKHVFFQIFTGLLVTLLQN